MASISKVYFNYFRGQNMKRRITFRWFTKTQKENEVLSIKKNQGKT